MLSALLTCGVGCQTRHHVSIDEGGQPNYEKLALVYDLQSTRLLEQGTEIQQTSSSHDADGSWPFARLRIEYPHPNNKPGYARATLRLGRAPITASSPGWSERVRGSLNRLVTDEPAVDDSEQLDDEVWALDLPREQLDTVLIDLTERGFFKDQTRPTGDAKLKVSIDRGMASKRWSSEPQLDDLIHRIYSDGWLAWYIDCQHAGIVRTGWSL